MNYLLRYLEFTGLDDFARFIAKLKNVYPPVKIVEVNLVGWREIVNFQYFFSQEIINQEIIRFIVSLLEIKVYNRCGRVRIEFDELDCEIFSCNG